MKRGNRYPIFLAGVVVCLLALLAAAPAPAAPANWFDEQAAQTAAGAPSIRVSLGEQRAYFYKGKKLVGVSRISSGRAGYRTPTGNFRVLSKKERHRSTLYGSYLDRNTHKVVRANVDTRKHRRPAGTYYRGASMNYFIRYHGGIGFHASNDVPSHPASHGCVRMPTDMARKFYRYAPVGTRVVVTH